MPAEVGYALCQRLDLIGNRRRDASARGRDANAAHATVVQRLEVGIGDCRIDYGDAAGVAGGLLDGSMLLFAMNSRQLWMVSWRQ
jgi:hypothetical protein